MTEKERLVGVQLLKQLTILKSNMSEQKFAKGIFFDKPREGAPEFVRGRMAMNQKDAIEYIQSLTPSEKGFVYFDLLKSKDGSKLYFTLNEWKPTPKTDATASVLPEYPAEVIDPSDVPF